LKNNGNKLLRKTFFTFLLQLVIWSVSLPIILWIITEVVSRSDFQWLYNISPNLYYFSKKSFYFLFSTVYFIIPFVVIWLLGDIILLYRLLKRVFFFIDAISKASKEIADKNIEFIDLPPELEELEKQMNALKRESERNEHLAREAEERKNDLVVYLAHDLKTPLTSVIGYLTLLRDEKQISEELREKYLSISLKKAEHLEDLINEFFEITRFNLSHIPLEYSKVNLTRFLEQLTFEFKPMFLEKNLNCVLKIAPDTMIKCDVNKMQRVFDNLLRNAINYSYENTTIQITAEQIGNHLSIKFTNCGNTIPKEKLERIFEQFYRLDTSRSTRSGGAGLGLAIAKEIVELHKGKITARSENETIEFEVSLPVL